MTFNFKSTKIGTVPVEGDVCTNCHFGTIGLEDGHFVCRGECGFDFGSSPILYNDVIFQSMDSRSDY